jgi:hypothetical protein
VRFGYDPRVQGADMRFNQAWTIVKACRAASRYIKIVPNFQGTNGIGKTAGMSQMAEVDDMGYIPMYLAQSEPSDLKGMPYADTAAGRTRYLLPEDLPTADLTMIQVMQELARAGDISLTEVFGIRGQEFHAFVDDAVRKILGIDNLDCVRRGALRRAHAEVYSSLAADGVTGLNRLRAFVAMDQDADHEAFRTTLIRIQGRMPEGVVHLDELNRAMPATKQSAFALLSEGRIGQYVLPAGWSVVVTENYEEGGDFDVANFKDAAWADRFVYIDWDVDQKFREDWSVWMAKKYGQHAAGVIATIGSNASLFSTKNGQVPTAKPSPRSWDKVAAFVAVRDEIPGFTDEIFSLLLIGLVGSDAAGVFSTETLPVSPMEILEDGVKTHRAALDTIKSKRGSILGLMAGVLGYARDTIATNPKYQAHSLDFAEWITDSLSSNRDVVIAFLKAITEAAAKEKDANATFGSNLVVNEQVAKMVALGRARIRRVASKEIGPDFMDAVFARKKLQDAVAILTGKKD